MFRRGDVEQIETQRGNNMFKSLDFAATEARAAKMTDEELDFARTDARETAEIWDGGDKRTIDAMRDQIDPDGNSGYYRDEATVYAREQEKRRKARE
jgi:formamidopyrimidine-DNA glycosylase